MSENNKKIGMYAILFIAGLLVGLFLRSFIGM